MVSSFYSPRVEFLFIIAALLRVNTMLLRYSLLFLISLASLRGRISVLALHLTERTAFNKDLQERYPEPTAQPRGSNAIRARQAGPLNPGVCGWIKGNEGEVELS